jgi:hypothetical protein
MQGLQCHTVNGAEDPAAVAHARRMGVEWREAVRIERGELAGHAGIVRRSVAACETAAADDRPMNTTKPKDPKVPKGKRRDYRLPPRPTYPDSYVHARGRRASHWAGEKNA